MKFGMFGCLDGGADLNPSLLLGFGSQSAFHLWQTACTQKVFMLSTIESEITTQHTLGSVQVVKVLTCFGGLSLGNPIETARASKLFQGESLCPSTVQSGSEYGL